jgi:hypothetical protein
MNSEFATRVANCDLYDQWRLKVQAWQPVSLVAESERMLPDGLFNLRYVDWSEEFRGRRQGPTVLDERDFDALSRSDCLLARKFDPRRSAKLLDQIDRLLRAHAPTENDPATPALDLMAAKLGSNAEEPSQGLQRGDPADLERCEKGRAAVRHRLAGGHSSA